jgi:hypothetical protein
MRPRCSWMHSSPGVLVPGCTARPRNSRLWQSRRFWEAVDAALVNGGELLGLYEAYRRAVASAPAVGDTANSGPGGAVATVPPAAGDSERRDLLAEQPGLRHGAALAWDSAANASWSVWLIPSPAWHRSVAAPGCARDEYRL